MLYQLKKNANFCNMMWDFSPMPSEGDKQKEMTKETTIVRVQLHSTLMM